MLSIMLLPCTKADCSGTIVSGKKKRFFQRLTNSWAMNLQTDVHTEIGQQAFDNDRSNLLSSRKILVLPPRTWQTGSLKDVSNTLINDWPSDNQIFFERILQLDHLIRPLLQQANCKHARYAKVQHKASSYLLDTPKQQPRG